MNRNIAEGSNWGTFPLSPIIKSMHTKLFQNSIVLKGPCGFKKIDRILFYEINYFIFLQRPVSTITLHYYTLLYYYITLLLHYTIVAEQHVSFSEFESDDFSNTSC